jgi:Sec7-like guanine-nucleotide exchange factor
VSFLKSCNRISETSMIEILGYHKEKCIAVMEGYLESFDFAGLSVVDGLRLFLSNFLMFGES